MALRHTPITAHGAEMGHRLVEVADHGSHKDVVGPVGTRQAARSTSQWIAAPAPSEFDDLFLSATAVASSSPTEDPAQSTAAHTVESFKPMATSPNRAPDDRWRPRSAPPAWLRPLSTPRDELTTDNRVRARGRNSGTRAAGLGRLPGRGRFSEPGARPRGRRAGSVSWKEQGPLWPQSGSGRFASSEQVG